MSLAEILDDFELLDDWEDRYRYIIELGKNLPQFDESWRKADNKVAGCVSQVWLHKEHFSEAGDLRIRFYGDSDAHIVRGLIALLFAIFNERPAREIIDADVGPILARIGLIDHLTPQRSNGFTAMIRRIKQEARDVLPA